LEGRGFSKEYLGFLDLLVNVARIATQRNEQALTLGRPKHVFGRAVHYALPIICRTNFAQVWAYLHRASAPHKQPSPEDLQRHLRMILGNRVRDILYPLPVNSYDATFEVVKNITSSLTPPPPGGHTPLSAATWIVEHSDEYNAAYRTWQQQNSHMGVGMLRLPRLSVRDWAHAITRGRDLLSDRHSLVKPRVVFKSMGAWDLGENGTVAVEVRTPFFTTLLEDFRRFHRSRAHRRQQQAAAAVTHGQPAPSTPPPEITCHFDTWQRGIPLGAALVLGKYSAKHFLAPTPNGLSPDRSRLFDHLAHSAGADRVDLLSAVASRWWRRTSSYSGRKEGDESFKKKGNKRERAIRAWAMKYARSTPKRGGATAATTHRRLADSDGVAAVGGTAPPAPACGIHALMLLAATKTVNTRLLAGYMPWNAAMPEEILRMARTDNSSRHLCAARVQHKFGRALPYPVVVKPAIGNHGNGVRLNVHSDAELCDVAGKTLGRQDATKSLERSAGYTVTGVPEVLVEQQVEGANFRVLVYQNRTIDVIERLKATVLGNGTATLNQLIAERNLRQRRAGRGHETHTISWTIILDKHGLSGADVVPRGLRVEIPGPMTRRRRAWGGWACQAASDAWSCRRRRRGRHAWRVSPKLVSYGVRLVYSL
jgi:hypothetical protein